MKDKAAGIIIKLKEISLKDPVGRSALVSFLKTLEGIVGTHSIRVSDYAVMTGRELQLPEESITNLYTSALLHDIGKLFIPPEILNKTGNLSGDELEVIHQHPVTGEGLLKKVRNYRQFAGIVLYHHEFFNGRGYPSGISGSDIPLLSRIIAVADAYEAMTSERPYRKGFSHREAVNRLRAGRFTQFDPEITDAFLKAIRKYPSQNY